jgi:hypothetical protein
MRQPPAPRGSKCWQNRNDTLAMCVSQRLRPSVSPRPANPAEWLGRHYRSAPFSGLVALPEVWLKMSSTAAAASGTKASAPVTHAATSKMSPVQPLNADYSEPVATAPVTGMTMVAEKHSVKPHPATVAAETLICAPTGTEAAWAAGANTASAAARKVRGAEVSYRKREYM